MAEAPPTSPSGGGRPRVIILGAGFAGLYTALALAADPAGASILLIEPREHFLFLPLLYELLSAELPAWQVAPRYDDLLTGHGIPRLAERVEAIDTNAGWVQTSSGQRLHYDRLVIACGGGADHFGIPGAEQHSIGFRSLGDLERLQALLAELRRRSRPLQRLAIVGAGPTGVELACKLADLSAGDAVIELIEQGGTLLPGSPSFNREQAERALQRRDVRLRCHTRVTAVRSDALELRHRDPTPSAAGSGDAPAPVSSDELLPVNGVLWTAGLRFRPPQISPSPEQDPQGRLWCDPELRLLGQQRVFVAGDLARVRAGAGAGSAAAAGDADGAPLPASAQVAFQQASLLARNLRLSLAGEPLQPFHWRNLGEMLSLGRGEACLTAAGFTLAGPAAFRLRRLAYLTRLPGLGQQLRAAAAWLVESLP